MSVTNETSISEPLAEGEMIGLQSGDRHILLCNIEGKHYAVSNICSHGRVLLSKGRLRGGTVTCPLHGARFDVTTGQCLGGPATQDIPSYPVTEKDGQLVIATDG